jgi:hypothetical protein
MLGGQEVAPMPWTRYARLALVALIVACAATRPGPEPGFELFSVPDPADSWTVRIHDWQEAQRFALATDSNQLPPLSPLAEEYERFSRELRAQLVRDTVRWVQTYSGLYYRADLGPDVWPTLLEVNVNGADDCDGMDLLTFELLRRLGFGPGEIFRAVLRQPPSGVHHMVTLWFPEGRTSDPLVLDPTGDVTRAVVPLSRIEGWEPVAVFDEASQYRAEPRS